jgi:hypothetical protein
MNKEVLSKVVSKLGGSPIARVTMAPGRYFGQKVSEDYSIVQETAEGWKPISKPEEAKAGARYIIFNGVKNHKSGGSVPISVNLEFMALPLKSNFSFSINDKGYSSLDLKPLTDKQIKELVAE